ncbi:MAG: TRAP transporter small permease [Eubacteriales bacterium]|nr:TRAP transporter small permease [Eubacteriales bacterium]
MKKLKKLYEIFSSFEKYFLFLVFFLATIFVVINVFGRKIFGFSLNWLEELNRYILVCCTLVGASIAVTDGRHPRMDSVVGIFKGRARLVIETVSMLIFVIFSAFMAYYAFRQFAVMQKLGAMTATLNVPVYVFFVFIPIGFLGMTVRSALKLIMMVKETADEEKTEEGK